ncbi:uncharacterized protein LOC121373330 [Gigantopelta aegis]|uniref:uncharacterized protein LOC121373330 n=1 Tax=Gigantopelta aegis TaxID=1735272 RepID=UPI001B88C71D|nr:uncharacterized protein LOC121373330 [Gigantopelta aegis]
MVLLVWLVSVLFVSGVTSYAVDFTDVQQQVSQPTDRRTDDRVIGILRSINSLIKSGKDELTTDLTQNRFHSIRQKGIDNSQSSNRLPEEKRDMSVLPPWNEFCRMVGLKQCFHSRY